LKIKKRNSAIALIFTAFHFFCDAQITPPGLGKTPASLWLAVALQQELDTIKNKGWQSTTYLGYARISNPNTFNPLDKPGIFILNQEFAHQFHKNLQYTLALSYRRQHEYSSTAPYYHDNPDIMQEFRFYTRFSYSYKAKYIKLTPTLRQDFRKFFTPDFQNYSDNWQIRTRFRLQLAVNLDTKNMHKIIINSEQLFSSTQNLSTKKWNGYKYRDSRFSLFYAYSPKTMPCTFNIGYMNNLIGTTKLFDGHYFSLDVTFKNLFSKSK
jgi:hypothetical protein